MLISYIKLNSAHEDVLSSWQTTIMRVQHPIW